MKIIFLISSFVLVTANALAALPMGLKCEPTFKISDAEVGNEGEYEVQKGMQKEKHRALINRKKISAVDGCSYNLEVGQIVVVRYNQPEVYETQVQCIDLNNNNAMVTFPKSIYTVRNSRIPQYHLNPYCPDGVSKDGFPCSKLDSQSQRSTEYQEKVLRWKNKDGGEGKNKLYLIDLRFDPPFQKSVPAGAKLFCALINKAGNVVIAGTAQYSSEGSAPTASSNEETAPQNRTRPAPTTFQERREMLKKRKM